MDMGDSNSVAVAIYRHARSGGREIGIKERRGSRYKNYLYNCGEGLGRQGQGYYPYTVGRYAEYWETTSTPAIYFYLSRDW